MKKIFFILLVSYYLFILQGFAQNVGINSGGVKADASAILDLKSNTKGFLVPRMTAFERMVIRKPATGLLVYQTDGKTGFYYNKGTAAVPLWTPLSGELSISATDPYWSTTGNAGTDSLINFLGTLDARPLRIRVNNIQAGEINPNTGNVALGLRALASTTTGTSNVAIGRDALRGNTAGLGLVAIGD